MGTISNFIRMSYWKLIFRLNGLEFNPIGGRGTISKPNTFSAGAVIVASEHNDNFDTVYNAVNGGLQNVNIAADAAIVDTKLAQITTAAKVSATAFTETSEAAGNVLGHDGTNWSSISASTARYRPLISMGSTSAAVFAPLNLASASGITGALAVANGGTGQTGDNLIKGWAVINGVTDALIDSFNVASVATNNTGKYKINWDTNFANSNHAIVATCVPFSNDYLYTSIVSVLAGSCVVVTLQNDSTPKDCTRLNVIALGDQ